MWGRGRAVSLLENSTAASRWLNIGSPGSRASPCSQICCASSLRPALNAAAARRTSSSADGVMGILETYRRESATSPPAGDVVARLDRATQYAAASRLFTESLWNTGCPGQAGARQYLLAL